MTPKWELDETKYMRADDLERLFDAVELAARRDREKGRTTWPRRFALLTVMHYAGLRVSEVAALRVNDLELHAERARVLVREGKYRKAEKGKPKPKPEYAPLAVTAVPILRDYLQAKENWGESVEPDAFLFPSRGGHIQKRAIQHGFKQALELAGLPTNYSPHALRHSYGVYVYKKTKDLRLCQKALRHKRSTTTETYADVLPEDVHAGVNGALGNGKHEPLPASMALRALLETQQFTREQQNQLIDLMFKLQKEEMSEPTPPKPTKPKPERKTPPKPSKPKKEKRSGADRRQQHTKPEGEDRRTGTERRKRPERVAVDWDPKTKKFTKVQEELELPEKNGE